MAQGIFAGGIKFGVSMDTKRLKKDTTDSRKMMARFTTGAVKGLKAFGVAASVASAAFSAMVKEQFAAIDTLAKTADKLGTTTEALTGLRHAASQTGVASGKIDSAMQRMVRNTTEASRGFSEASEEIGLLGLNAKDLAQMDASKQFQVIADSMNQIDNQNDKLQIAIKLFGRAGGDIVNTLALGSEGLKKYNQDARDLGMTVSRFDAAKVERANDAMERFYNAMQGFAKRVVTFWAPKLEAAANWGTKLVAPENASFGRNRPFLGSAAQLRADMKNDTRRMQERDARELAKRNAATAARKKAQEQLGGGIAKGMFDMLRKGKQEGLAAVGRAQWGAMMLQRQGAIANTKMIGARKAGVQREQARGSLQFTRSGTAASYQQRAATKRQNEQINLDKTRNATLRSIEQGITKMDMAPAILG